MSSKKSPSTLGKAIQLLIMLSNEHREVGTTELANKLGMHKATASRILIKLAEYGFVYKNKENRKYWLGPAIHQMGMTMAHVSFNDVIQVARRHVDELSDTVKETVALEIWLGNSTVSTYYAQSNQHSNIVPPPGKQLVVHAAAGARAILAYTHNDRVEMLLEGELVKVTGNTVVDKEHIKANLLSYLQQGYAVDYEEMNDGICAIAAPIFDQLRRPIAAMVVLMPPSRASQLENPDLVSRLKAKTALISKELSANKVRRKS